MATVPTSQELYELDLEQLKKLADEATLAFETLRGEKLDTMCEEFKAAIEEQGFTLQEVIENFQGYLPAAGQSSPAPAPQKSSTKKQGKAPPKYQGPNGETWAGRGSEPKWIKALKARGEDIEKYRIKDTSGIPRYR